jgi:uncharacterized repeat protein (TIGR01451 family)
VTYTIKASNAGPSDEPNATVADTFPATVTSTSWTCVGAGGGTCPASGTGNISTTVNLPSGGSVTYTAIATIGSSATGTLSNTATVAVGSGSDPVPGNDAATDTDTLSPSADLSITKTDGVTSATPGGAVTYTITASNAGPSDAADATVVDTFPAAVTSTSWTCVGAGGGTCPASGTGNVNATVDLPSGGSVTYTTIATIGASATGTLSNTATVAVGSGSDPVPGNDSATDTDALTPVASAPAAVSLPRAAYCAAAGDTDPLTGARYRPGQFLNLVYGQPAADDHYAGAILAWFVEGEGLTCDSPPAGYTNRGLAGAAQHVPAGVYGYWAKPGP